MFLPKEIMKFQASTIIFIESELHGHEIHFFKNFIFKIVFGKCTRNACESLSKICLFVFPSWTKIYLNSEWKSWSPSLEMSFAIHGCSKLHLITYTLSDIVFTQRKDLSQHPTKKNIRNRLFVIITIKQMNPECLTMYKWMGYTEHIKYFIVLFRVL